MRLSSLAPLAPKPLRTRAISILPSSSRELAKEVRIFLEKALDGLPWPVEMTDWEENHYSLGGDESHWCKRPLIVKMFTPESGRDLLALSGLRFLERFLVDEVRLAARGRSLMARVTAALRQMVGAGPTAMLVHR